MEYNFCKFFFLRATNTYNMLNDLKCLKYNLNTTDRCGGGGEIYNTENEAQNDNIKKKQKNMTSYKHSCPVNQKMEEYDML